MPKASSKERDLRTIRGREGEREPETLGLNKTRGMVPLNTPKDKNVYDPISLLSLDLSMSLRTFATNIPLKPALPP